MNPSPIQAPRHPLVILSFLFLLLTLVSRTQSAPYSRMNTLVLYVDDLHPELGCYGSKTVKGANIAYLPPEAFALTRRSSAGCVCTLAAQPDD